ncbi:MAG: FkbM family methyltransferase [Anaerolineaceae bacterium]|nr:FkbM family methyltransferase [Anaerolineaceae bacterium]
MRRSIKRWGRKIISVFKRPNPNIATEKDLYACYWLLLNRKPDKQGLNHWLNLMEKTQMERQVLVGFFLLSEEFQRQRLGLRRQRTLVNLPDFKMVVNPNDFSVGSSILRNKKYEAHVSQAIKSQLKSGDVFVDIGANIGYFTLLAAATVGEKGHVYAFEPNPSNCELIRENIALNEYSNVTLFPYAVAESRQTLNYYGESINSNGQVSDISEGEEALVKVEAVALDELLLDSEKITVVKMDIEGAEARAFSGMSQIIDKFRPVIFTEFSPHLLNYVSHVQPEAYLTSLQEHYDVFVLESEEFKGLRFAEPASVQEIMEKYARTNDTHLDLAAFPREVKK